MDTFSRLLSIDYRKIKIILIINSYYSILNIEYGSIFLGNNLLTNTDAFIYFPSGSIDTSKKKHIYACHYEKIGFYRC